MSDSTTTAPLLCDHCGQVIEQLADAWVQWVTNSEGQIVRVYVVHHGPASPVVAGCYLASSPEGRLWQLPAHHENFAGRLREAQHVRAHLREAYGFAKGAEGLDSVRALEKAARAWAAQDALGGIPRSPDGC